MDALYILVSSILETKCDDGDNNGKIEDGNKDNMSDSINDTNGNSNDKSKSNK